jgi:hypothetical protein
VAGVVAGIVITTLAGAALGLRAQDPSTDVQEAAAQAGVDAQDLLGAVNTTGVDPYVYLRGVGELPPLKPPAATSNPRVECIIAHESRGNPGAVNPRSGASGLGQFLRGTWLSTPQGRAGLSVFDPVANRAAVVYMLAVGRAREFVAVSAGYC